jgi:hypothetical protein
MKSQFVEFFFFYSFVWGIPSKEQAATIINTMMTKFGGDDMYLCSIPTSERFNPKKYWRGPVWINLNWILYNGLRIMAMMILLSVKSDTVGYLQW